MSRLEDLVPPLEMCKRIPEGKFTDSCFVRPDQVCGNPVWTRGTRHYYRMDACGIKMFPAPTLAEIMAEIPCFMADNYLAGNNVFTIVAAKKPEYRSDYHGGRDCNPATAALKLYLELLSVPSEVHK